MQQYLDALNNIIKDGQDKGDRTGTGTRAVFGRMMRFDLNEGFPLLTTKKVHLKSIIYELLWFLSGDTNSNTLKENGVRIWDEWALEDGRLGPIYSKQWVSWDDTKMIRPEGIARYIEQGYTYHGLVLDEVTGHPIAVVRRTINQIQNAIDTLKTNPNSRRIIVSAWNPADLPDESISPHDNVRNGKAALPACHTFFQFYTEELSLSERLMWVDVNKPELLDDYTDALRGQVALSHAFLDEHKVPRHKLSCLMYQRSCDSFLGMPFNIASYALLTMMVAQQCNMAYGDYIHVTGDTHLYQDHLQDPTIVMEQLQREPRHLPKMCFARKPDSIFDYKYEDFLLDGYHPHPAIKAKVSV